MSNTKLTVTVDENAVDIPTMRDMPIDEYEFYVLNGMLFVDDDNVLRSALGQYPLAVTAEQLDTLISYLEALRGEVGGEAA
jgi:hypothetical protein